MGWRVGHRRGLRHACSPRLEGCLPCACCHAFARPAWRVGRRALARPALRARRCALARPALRVGRHALPLGSPKHMVSTLSPTPPPSPLPPPFLPLACSGTCACQFAACSCAATPACGYVFFIGGEVGRGCCSCLQHEGARARIPSAAVEHALRGGSGLPQARAARACFKGGKGSDPIMASVEIARAARRGCYVQGSGSQNEAATPAAAGSMLSMWGHDHGQHGHVRT